MKYFATFLLFSFVSNVLSTELTCGMVKNLYQDSSCCPDVGGNSQQVITGCGDKQTLFNSTTQTLYDMSYGHNARSLRYQENSVRRIRRSATSYRAFHVQKLEHELLEPMTPCSADATHFYCILEHGGDAHKRFEYWTDADPNDVYRQHGPWGVTFWNIGLGADGMMARSNATVFKINRLSGKLEQEKLLGSITGSFTTDLSIGSKTGKDMSRGPMALYSDYLYIPIQGYKHLGVSKVNKHTLVQVWYHGFTSAVLSEDAPQANTQMGWQSQMRIVGVMPPNSQQTNPIVFGTLVGQEYTTVEFMSLAFLLTDYHRPNGVKLYAVEDLGETTQLKWEFQPSPVGYSIGEKIKETHFDGASHTSQNPMAIYVPLIDGMKFQDEGDGSRPSTVFRRQKLIYSCGTGAIVPSFDPSSSFPALTYVNPHQKFGRDTCKAGYVQFSNDEVFSKSKNYTIYKHLTGVDVIGTVPGQQLLEVTVTEMAGTPFQHDRTYQLGALKQWYFPSIAHSDYTIRTAQEASGLCHTGGGFWMNPLTIDAERRRVIVGGGNAYYKPVSEREYVHHDLWQVEFTTLDEDGNFRTDYTASGQTLLHKHSKLVNENTTAAEYRQYAHAFWDDIDKLQNKSNPAYNLNSRANRLLASSVSELDADTGELMWSIQLNPDDTDSHPNTGAYMGLGGIIGHYWSGGFNDDPTNGITIYNMPLFDNSCHPDQDALGMFAALKQNNRKNKYTSLESDNTRRVPLCNNMEMPFKRVLVINTKVRFLVYDLAKLENTLTHVAGDVSLTYEHGIKENRFGDALIYAFDEMLTTSTNTGHNIAAMTVDGNLIRQSYSFWLSGGFIAMVKNDGTNLINKIESAQIAFDGYPNGLSDRTSPVHYDRLFLKRPNAGKSYLMSLDIKSALVGSDVFRWVSPVQHSSQLGQNSVFVKDHEVLVGNDYNGVGIYSIRTGDYVGSVPFSMGCKMGFTVVDDEMLCFPGNTHWKTPVWGDESELYVDHYVLMTPYGK